MRRRRGGGGGDDAELHSLGDSACLSVCLILTKEL